MRKVKVPDFMQPFEVIVNGVKHVFPAGETVTVEDYIADIIEQSVPPKAEAKVERVMWEDIGNRPFGYSPTGGDTLTWDGNTEGRGTVGQFVKVSDVVLTKADFANGASATLNNSEVFTLTAEEIQAAFFEDNAFFSEILAGIPYDGYDLGDGFVAAAGIYFLDTRLDEGNVYISSLTIPGYTGFPGLKKIEPEYLPEAILFRLDEDKYLYETPDTSDPANRVTMARLKEIALSPRQKYVYGEFEGGYAYVSVMAMQFDEDLGYGMALGIESAGYTAEYTPST